LVTPTNTFLNGGKGLVNLSTGGSTTPATGGSFTVPANSSTNQTPFNQTAPTPSSVNLSSLPGYSSLPASSPLYGANSGSTGTSGIPKPGQLTSAQLMAQYPGYSFNAAGQLVNAQGQQYQPSTQTGTSAPTQKGTPGLVSLPNTNPASSQNQNPYTAAAPTFPGLVGSLASTASQPSASYTAAQNQYNQANQGLVNLEQQAAQAQGSVNNTPGISLQGATGESGQIQNTLANEAAPLAQEMTAAQAAASNATTQQGTQQSGLAAAGGLAAPQPGQNPATQSYNPLTNTYSPLAANSAGTTGTSAAQALENVGSLNGEQAVGANVAANQSILNAAQSTGTSLQNLISTAGINPSQFSIVNGALQAGASQLSNANYQKFAGQISDFISKIAPILGGSAGASTNYQTQLASQILNQWQSGQSINDVISYFLNQAQNNLNAMGTTGQTTANSNGSINTNATGNTNNSTGGTTFGSFFGS
jgi:hypothetical protein